DVGTFDGGVELVEAALPVGVVYGQVGESLQAARHHVLDDAGDHQAVRLRRLEDPVALVDRLDDVGGGRHADVGDPGLLDGVDDGQAVGRDGAADHDVDVVLLDQAADVRDRLARVGGGV